MTESLVNDGQKVTQCKLNADTEIAKVALMVIIISANNYLLWNYVFEEAENSNVEVFSGDTDTSVLLLHQWHGGVCKITVTSKR